MRLALSSTTVANRCFSEPRHSSIGTAILGGVEDAALGINPGGSVLIQDVTGDPRIREGRKNKLKTDDATLISLGSLAEH